MASLQKGCWSPSTATGDNNWYRAVVLEVCKEEVSVLYADYGNTEKLPISRITPIPKNLLEPPFQIIRCALIGEAMARRWNESAIHTHSPTAVTRFHVFLTVAGQESFPAERPEEVLLTFKSLLSECSLATALHFDGHVNVLSFNLPSGGLVHEKILAMLQTEPDDKLAAQQAPEASTAGWLCHISYHLLFQRNYKSIYMHFDWKSLSQRLTKYLFSINFLLCDWRNAGVTGIKNCVFMSIFRKLNSDVCSSDGRNSISPSNSVCKLNKTWRYKWLKLTHIGAKHWFVFVVADCVNSGQCSCNQVLETKVNTSSHSSF